MSSVRSVDEVIGELSGTFSGQLLRPADAGYDEARRVHNGLVDKRPALIARCRGVADVVDPLGGSYYIESLTSALEQKAADYIKRIDELGGAVKAVEKGFVAREIEESAYRYQKEIERGERTVVGLNKFQEKEAPYEDLLRVNPAVRESQLAKLKKLRAERNEGQVHQTLDELQKAAAGAANLMPLIIDAVRAEATLGEICNVLRKVFGEYKAAG